MHLSERENNFMKTSENVMFNVYQEGRLFTKYQNISYVSFLTRKHLHETTYISSSKDKRMNQKCWCFLATKGAALIAILELLCHIKLTN